MPAPATVNEFLELVRKSTVVDETRLTAYLQQLQTNGTVPSEPNKLAGLLIRDGILTYFQAEQFLQGRWKRFTIGRYKVLERLGSGGMGQVFLCEHKVMRRRVAVKVLPTAKAEDPSSLERFYREARAVAALDHPNIVRAYDIDQDDNLHFLVMEYVDGVSIQDVIKKFGPMDVLRTCHYIYQSAIGLQHAHESGLVHRDIKPGNILVDRQGVVKILDMGLARFFHDEEDIITKRYDESVLGTADYLAPEQAIDSHSVDIRADIYSLGATFYYMLTGSPPFAEGTVAQKLIWHQTRLPRPIQSMRPDVPPEVLAVVEQMMAKDMNQRYQTPADLIMALAPLVQTPIGPPPDREMPQLCLAAQGRDMSGGPASQSAIRKNDAAGASAVRRANNSSVQLPTQRTNPSSGTTRTTSSDPVTRSGGANPTAAPRSQAGQVPPVPRTPAPTPAAPRSAAPPSTPASSPKPAAPYAPTPVQDPYSPVWESLTNETANNAQSDTDRRAAPVSTPSMPEMPFRSESNPKPKWLLLAVGGIILVALGIAGYMLFGTGKAIETAKEDHTLIVSKSQEGDGRFPTLRSAIEKARPGDRIVVTDDVIIEDPLTFSSSAGFPKNLTIEAGNAARLVTWHVKAPTKPTNPHPSLLELRAVEGLKLRGFIFDCQNHADSVLRVVGKCPGLLLDEVEILGARSTVIRMIDAAGEPDRPITIQKARFLVGKDAEAALSFKTPNSASGANQSIIVRDCRFEGPCKLAAIMIEFSISDVRLIRNRFYNFPTGILFRSAQVGNTNQIIIEQNTFSDITEAAIKFGDAHLLTPDPMGKPRYSLSHNYFRKCKSLLGAPAATPISGWAASYSGRDSTSVDAANFKADVIADALMTNTNSTDETNFLRIEAGNKLLTAGLNGRAIGYVPE